METEQIEYNFRFTVKLTENRGVLYAHIPKDLGRAWKLGAYDVVDFAILRVYPKEKEEKKK